MAEAEYKEEQSFGYKGSPAICMYTCTLHLDKIKEHIDKFGEEYTRTILSSHFNQLKVDLYIGNAKNYG